MKRIIVAFIFMFISMSIGIAQPFCSETVDSLKEQMGIINKADSVLLCLLPDSFEEYYFLCGDVDSPLYDSFDIIEHLYNSEGYESNFAFRSKFIDKLVSISTSGFLSADHIAFLQETLRELLHNSKHLQQVLQSLNAKSFQENIGFWRFVFSSTDLCTCSLKDQCTRDIEILEKKTGFHYSFFESIENGYQIKESYYHTH